MPEMMMMMNPSFSGSLASSAGLSQQLKLPCQLFNVVMDDVILSGTCPVGLSELMYIAPKQLIDVRSGLDYSLSAPTKIDVCW